MSDWSEHVDPGSGRKYYYNASTGVTTWDPPAGLTASASDWQKLNDASSGRDYFYNTKTGVTQWEVPAGWEEKGAGATGSASTTSATRNTSEEPAATRRSATARKSMISRRGAIAKRSTAKPQTVTEKLATRAKKFVQLRKAEKAKSQPSAFARKRGTVTSATAAIGATGAKESAADQALPANWQAAVDPDSGKTYYYNTVTNETAWDLPA